VKNFTRRLSIKGAIIKLRLAIALVYLGHWTRRISDKCWRLQKRLVDSAVPPKPEEPCVYEPGPIDKYTLDLMAWRGPDGEGLTQFAITPAEAQRIIAALGDGSADVLHPVAELVAVIHRHEAA
jgi:hypothetical protein